MADKDKSLRGLYVTEGKLLSCQRTSCNNIVFLKHYAMHHPDDDGYQDPPEGWKICGGGLMLCPACSKEYDDMMLEFHLRKPLNYSATYTVDVPHLNKERN